MIITHIVGNGFDLNQGIPTSYAHFYEYYLQLKPAADESEVVSRFRSKMYQDLLEEKTDLWSDMELALGKATNDFNTAAEFEIVYLDVYRRLMEYIDSAYHYSDLAKFENPEKTLYQDLMKPWMHLVERDIVEIEKSFQKIREAHVQILNFNYTDTFNRIADLKKKENGVLGRELLTTFYYDGCIHIHHAIGNRDIILGVDNKGQIANGRLGESESIRNLLIKPQTNMALGTLVDQQCRDVIGKSDIISIYGVSLGETDLSWWREIGKRIKSNLDVRILYFPFEKELDKHVEIQKPTLRENKKRALMKALGIDSISYRDFNHRIFVNFCNNQGGRNIFTNPRRENLIDNFEHVMAVFQNKGKIIVPQPAHDNTSLGIDISHLMPVRRLFETRYYKPKYPLGSITKDPL